MPTGLLRYMQGPGALRDRRASRHPPHRIRTYWFDVDLSITFHRWVFGGGPVKGKFSLSAADAAFIRSAPLVITHRIESEATCESLWQTLTSDGALTSWAHGITGADWTSDRPFGIGTTRTVRAGAFAALNERFFRWDEGRRMSFYVESASLPGFKRFAEDLVLEPTSTGSRLTWTFAVQAQPWFAPHSDSVPDRSSNASPAAGPTAPSTTHFKELHDDGDRDRHDHTGVRRHSDTGSARRPYCFRMVGRTDHFEQRARRLDRWRGIIARRASELADVVHRDMGKPHPDAMLEIAMALEHLAWASKNARKVLGRRSVRSSLLTVNQAASVEYRPLGVIGVIGPWNYPVFTPLGSLSFSLAAGNAVVYKPSEFAPAVGQWLGRAFRRGRP